MGALYPADLTRSTWRDDFEVETPNHRQWHAAIHRPIRAPIPAAVPVELAGLPSAEAVREIAVLAEKKMGEGNRPGDRWVIAGAV